MVAGIAHTLNSSSLLDPVVKCDVSNFNNTRRYGPLRGPTSSSCGGLGPSAEAVFALRAKIGLIMLFWLIFVNFGVR